MLSIDALKAYGVNVQEGLGRCLNNEMFYFRLVKMSLADANVQKLGDALDRGDTHAAFEAAHALKGVMANLALTPILKPASELTEILRAGSREGAEALYEEIVKQRDALKALAES